VELSQTDDPLVLVEDLRFQYPVGTTPALKGISFQVRRGEFIGITGPSGSGKTTLALCLRGLIPHSVSGKMEGRVRACGMDTRQTTAAQLGEHVSLVFQDPEAQIVGLTVAEDLAFGPENYEWPRERILARIPEMLRLVRLDGFMDRETYSLSGGQKQRVAIAGALMMTPQLLIMDEPTSELDPIGREEVFDTVRRLRDEHDVTVIMIEHAVEQLAEFADRIILMDEGGIVAEGPPRQLFRDIELFHTIGGERLPQVAEVLFTLEQQGLLREEQFTPYEGEAVRVLNALLGGRHE
jgi:energy-coupling factor transporter ATP-binding protein EcfA2